MKQDANDSEQLERTKADVANAWQMLLGISQPSSARTARFAKRSIPFTLITGFLGSGKTTLLNNILTAPKGRRLAVVVNDFGAINIDAALVDAENSNSTSLQLQNGCVCCTLAAGLLSTIDALLEGDNPPDHIVLEASGVAEPMGIIQTILGREDITLGGVLCVVDADAAGEHLRQPEIRPTLERQLKHADLVLLNKLDLAGEEARASVIGWVAHSSPGAAIIETSYSHVPADIALGFSSQPDLWRGEVADHSQERFASISLTTEAAIDERRICEFIESLPPGVLRAKGLLRLSTDPEGIAVLQLVGRRWSLAKDSEIPQEGISSLVIIGLRGTLDAAALKSNFDRCRAD